MNAAIWSRLTVPEGLYVVADVPLASPEKYASAIWQKKGLLITSVNGRVIIWPPQAPVSARWRVDNVVSRTINEMSRTTRVKKRMFHFISLLLVCCRPRVLGQNCASWFGPSSVIQK